MPELREGNIMYSYEWDETTGGLLLTSSLLKVSKEPRPVYYQELDLLGFDKYWTYTKNDTYPYMWAEANNYFYRGRKVAEIQGGSCYTAPELNILESPEPEGTHLRFVDIPAMIEKNRAIMEGLIQETIKRVYNTYKKYKDKGKVDFFHVSYSGGKDSEVTFDIVQRALPHNAFIVLFGDTGMEFPDTYRAKDIIKKFCEENKIEFHEACSEFNPLDSWRKFGVPSSSMRWCCGVHKTAPQLLKLREVAGKPDLKEMAFVGIRSSESIRRSEYDYISFGTKHSGQFSFNPILEWNSAEVYMYIYMQNLHINAAYKKGSSRAGCLFCPMATEKSDFFNHGIYPEKVEPFIEIIKELYVDRKDEKLLNSYIENKGWKARKNGRDLSIGIGDYTETTEGTKRIITLRESDESWKEWIKTVGVLDYENGRFHLYTKNNLTFYFTISTLKDGYMKFIFDEEVAKNNPTVFKDIKNVLKKYHTCIACRYCEANCPYGNISFVNGKVTISDACIKCGLCNKIDNGCLVYNSLILPKGTGKMKKGSLDEYGTHPVKLEWIQEYIKYKENFEDKQTKLGKAMLPMFRKFLRNAGITNKNNDWTALAQILFKDELDMDYIWGLMFANLAYSAQTGWLIKNLDFDVTYLQNELVNMITGFTSSKTGPRNITNSFRHMSELPFSKVGFGEVIGKTKEGFQFIRHSWKNPDFRVILYSLYKFAEACDGYYQFTLSRLMNHNIESEGISPTEIFGISREQIEKILNGLAINYSEFISISFTLDLDNINLNSEKTAEDVLSLF